MPTSDELSRTSAPQTDFEVKFFVGPKRNMIVRENMEMGEAFNPTASTYLTASVNLDSGTIPVANASAFTSGAIMIHPKNANEAYEFIKYGWKSQSAFGSLTRIVGDADDTDFVWGSHSSGAVVSEFIEITERVEALRVDFNESDGVSLWRASLNGRRYDSTLMDNDNSVVAQIRQRPYNGSLATWSPWRVFFIGYIRECKIGDDGAMAKTWDMDVEGLSQYAATTETPPRHYGKNDLAEGKPVTVSSTLEDPYQEFGTGEYTGFPELSGDMVNDADMSTLWISNGIPDPNVETPYAGGMEINEVYLQPPLGYTTRDHQWIEVYCKRWDTDSDNLKYFCLTNKQTTYKPVHYDTPDHEPWDAYVPNQNWVQLPNSSMPAEEGSFVILTFNRPRFLEFFPEHASATVIDLRPHIIGSFELDVEGDFLLMRQGHVNAVSNVWWTDAGNAEWQSIAPYAISGDDGTFWQGSMITVPPRGHSFRRDPCGYGPELDAAKDNLGYWETDEVRPTPGYYFSGEAEWVAVDLGEMGITVEEEVSASELDTIKLSKEPLGLRSAGYIKINAEILAYTERDSDNNELHNLSRGLFGTSAATHPEGSVIYAIESLMEENNATTSYLVSSVSWKRKPVEYLPGKLIVPDQFELYLSNFSDPIYPSDPDWDEPKGQGGWQDYWERVQVVNAWRQTTWLSSFQPRRVRHVLMIINKMTDGQRVKLNQFSVWSDQVDVIEIPPGADEESRDAIDGAYSGAIVLDLLTGDIGLDPALFTMEDDGRPYSDLRTTTSNVLAVIRDICRRTGCSVVFDLDEEVTHRYNPLYPLADLEDIDITWDRDNARKVDLTRPFRHNVKQVVIRGVESNDQETFKAVFPLDPLTLGSTIEIEDWILEDPNDASLMAEYVFRQRNAPLTAIVTPIGPAEWVRPGQRHVINWDMDEHGQYLRSRNFVVTGVQWSLDFGGADPGAKGWATSIQLKELIF